MTVSEGKLWFSNCGPQTRGSISITLEPDRYAIPQAHPCPTESETLGIGPSNFCFNKPSQVILMQSQIQKAVGYLTAVFLKLRAMGLQTYAWGHEICLKERERKCFILTKIQKSQYKYILSSLNDQFKNKYCHTVSSSIICVCMSFHVGIEKNSFATGSRDASVLSEVWVNCCGTLNLEG